MSAQNDLDKALAAKAAGDRTFTYKGTTYTLGELPALIQQLREAVKAETAAKEEKKKEAAQLEATRGLKAAQASTAKAQKAFDNAVERFNKGTLSAEQVDQFRIRLATAQETEARLTPSKAIRPRAATPQPVGATQMGQQAEAARLAGLAATTPTPTPTPAGGVVTGKGAAAEKEGKVVAPPTTANILDELAQKFPAYRDWTLEQATGYFGADLIKVLNDAAAGVYGVGKDKDRDAITRAISGTQYWLNTEKAIRTWDGLETTAQAKLVQDQKRQLAQTFGELALDDATLTTLATTIQRTGLNDLGARQLVYGTAFSRPRTETGPQSRQLALESSVADEIRKIGESYGYKPRDLDAQIEAILTGKPYGPTGQVLTTDAFRQKAEKLARGSFGHLKDQFDSGLTLEDIFGNYRELASRVLEVDPNQIDFVKEPTKWMPAFGTAETGQMSLSDWVKKLKSEDQYGWQFTNQAKQQATNLVMEMEKAFGFRK